MSEFVILIYNTALATVLMSLSTMGIGIILGSLYAWCNRNSWKR